MHEEEGEGVDACPGPKGSISVECLRRREAGCGGRGGGGAPVCVGASWAFRSAGRGRCVEAVSTACLPPAADACDEAANPQPQPEEEVEGDRRAHHLLDVGADDGDLHHGVHDVGEPSWIVLSDRLREVLAGDDAQPRRHLLQDESHHRRPPQHPRQPQPSVRALLQIALEVARVEVGQGHQPAGAGEAPQLAPGEGERDALPPLPLVLLLLAVRLVVDLHLRVALPVVGVRTVLEHYARQQATPRPPVHEAIHAAVSRLAAC